MFVFVQVRNSSQAAAAASVASTKPVKNKKFRIYRWNPDKPGDKPKMQVGCDFSVLALNHFFYFFVAPAPIFSFCQSFHSFNLFWIIYESVYKCVTFALNK